MSDGSKPAILDPAGAPHDRMAWAWRTAGLAASVLLSATLYWTLRVARADWRFITGNPHAILEAIRLAPGNPDYYSGWAESEPNRAVEALGKAVGLSPLNSSLWIELGGAAERQGDFPKAESALRKAMRLDNGFAPRWALSDFYFRRHDAEKFWPVVKAALDVSYGDVSAQFIKCWAITSDPEVILDKAMPERLEVLRQYLGFLLNENRLDAAEPVAGKLLGRADKDAVRPLLTYCDRLLAAGRGRQALMVWNGLSERTLIPYPLLAPGPEASPVNRDFRRPSLGAGFDWLVSVPDGIHIGRAGNPPALTFSFSGHQSGNTDILSQYVPLLPRREYTLSVRYRVAGIGAEPGLTYNLLDADGKDLLSGRGILPGGAADYVDHETSFRTLETTTMARLVFGYHRMPGAVPIQGGLTLREVALSLVPEGGR